MLGNTGREASAAVESMVDLPRQRFAAVTGSSWRCSPGDVCLRVRGFRARGALPINTSQFQRAIGSTIRKNRPNFGLRTERSQATSAATTCRIDAYGQSADAQFAACDLRHFSMVVQRRNAPDPWCDLLIGLWIRRRSGRKLDVTFLERRVLEPRMNRRPG